MYRTGTQFSVSLSIAPGLTDNSFTSGTVGLSAAGAAVGGLASRVSNLAFYPDRSGYFGGSASSAALRYYSEFPGMSAALLREVAQRFHKRRFT